MKMGSRRVKESALGGKQTLRMAGNQGWTAAGKAAKAEKAEKAKARRSEAA